MTTFVQLVDLKKPPYFGHQFIQRIFFCLERTVRMNAVAGEWRLLTIHVLFSVGLFSIRPMVPCTLDSILFFQNTVKHQFSSSLSNLIFRINECKRLLSGFTDISIGILSFSNDLFASAIDILLPLRPFVNSLAKPIKEMVVVLRIKIIFKPFNFF